MNTQNWKRKADLYNSVKGGGGTHHLKYIYLTFPYSGNPRLYFEEKQSPEKLKTLVKTALVVG